MTGGQSIMHQWATTRLEITLNIFQTMVVFKYVHFVSTHMAMMRQYICGLVFPTT